MIRKISGILLFRTPSPAEKERDALIERTISSQESSSSAALATILYREPMSPLSKSTTKVDHEFGISDATMLMLNGHASSSGANDRQRGNSVRKSSFKFKS